MAESTTRRRRPAATTTTTTVADPPEAAGATSNESEAAPSETGDETGDQPEAGSNLPATTSKGTGKALSIPGIPGIYEARSLVLPEKMSAKTFVKVVDAISDVREGSRWWLGDALLYGENKSEAYSQALDSSKFDYGTLRNFRMVSKFYPPEARTFNVSHSHYQACVGLPLDQAIKILDEAERADWSVIQIRQYVKEVKAGNADPTPPASRTNGTAGGAAPSAAGSTAPAELPGIQPIDVSAFEGTVYDCPACNLTFDQPVWHCVGCGGHYAPDVEECPNPHCGETVEPDPTPSPAPAPAAVSGLIVNAGGRQIDASIIGRLIEIGQDIRKLDATSATEYILSSDILDPETALGAIMGLAEWLNQVATDLSTQTEAEDESSDAESGDSEDNSDADASEAEDDDSEADSAPEPAPSTAAKPAPSTVNAVPKPGATRKRGSKSAS